jgi:SHS2 domain-containing protein
MTTRGWEHFEHGADIGVRGFGPTLEASFEEAAMALAAVVADPAAVRPLQSITLACEAPGRDILLVDFLNAIIYEMATTGLLFTTFRVAIDGNRLRAEAKGEPFDPGRHDAAVEVKGATFTELSVGHLADGGWCAQCVVDV